MRLLPYRAWNRFRLDARRRKGPVRSTASVTDPQPGVACASAVGRRNARPPDGLGVQPYRLGYGGLRSARAANRRLDGAPHRKAEPVKSVGRAEKNFSHPATV